MSKNTVSIIIPVYNKEDYVERCINSVLEQTYKDIEIIVVDDGSTDRGIEIIKEMTKGKDFPVTIIPLEKNMGVARARNTGLSAATGEYVYFLDADDYIMPYTIELMASKIEKYNTLAGTISKGETIEPKDINDVKVKLHTKAKKTKALRGRTSANILIKRAYIKKHNLQFDENVKFFTDLSFSIPAIVKVKTLPMIEVMTYVKGECYEPIDNPSLSLWDEKEKVEDFLYLYNSLRDAYGKYTSIAAYLDKQLLTYYTKNITNVVLQSEEALQQWIAQLSEAMKKVNTELIDSKKFLEKRELKSVIKGDAGAVLKKMKQRDSYKRWEKTFKGKQELYKELYSSVLTKKLPVQKNLVVFESFGGKSYSCNPRYIYEELLKTNKDLEYIWILNDVTKEIPGKAKKVERNSWKYYYYLAKAKYWVTNARMPNHLVKRDETVYVQTWHGTPLKRLAADMKEVHMPGTTTEKYKKNFYNEARKWDYLVSPNDYSTEIFKRAFKFDKEMLDFGYPRNDILYMDEEMQAEKANEIKKKLGIPGDKKVILYAPTWRDDEFYEVGKYKFDIKLDLQKMQKKLGKDYVVVLRMHYLIAENMDISQFEDFVYDLSQYDDIAELYLISDVLITDYSSVFFDYANLRRPILFYTYDLDKYRDTLRGFYFDFEKEAPGPLLNTTDEVIKSIKNIKQVQVKYKEVFEKFYDKFCHLDNGKAAANIIEKVFR